MWHGVEPWFGALKSATYGVFTFGLAVIVVMPLEYHPDRGTRDETDYGGHQDRQPKIQNTHKNPLFSL
jgi:hypothetical protein